MTTRKLETEVARLLTNKSVWNLLRHGYKCPSNYIEDDDDSNALTRLYEISTVLIDSASEPRTCETCGTACSPFPHKFGVCSLWSPKSNPSRPVPAEDVEKVRKFAYKVLECTQIELGIEISEEAWAKIEDAALDRIGGKESSDDHQ